MNRPCSRDAGPNETCWPQSGKSASSVRPVVGLAGRLLGKENVAELA